MAIVTCKYCGKKFDRSKLPFIQIPAGSKFRYAHPECYRNAEMTGKEKKEGAYIDPAFQVLCANCGLPIDKRKDEFKEVGKNRFMHIKCAQEDAAKEKTPKEKLYDFILNQTGAEFVEPSLQKLIENYISSYGYTYSGIHGALKYWYIIKQNKIDRDNILGIIPYIYDDAKKFYKDIYTRREANNKLIKSYNKNTVQVIRTCPQRRTTLKHKYFSFLDQEEDNVE